MGCIWGLRRGGLSGFREGQGLRPCRGAAGRGGGQDTVAGQRTGVKKPDIFRFRGLLKGDFPYFCSPFWGLFLLSSVG